MKQKVLIVANDTTYVYNLRSAIIEELIKQKYEVYVVAKIKLFEKELNDMGCHLINTNFKRKTVSIFSNIKLLFKYKKILNDIKPNYILSYNIKPNIYCGIINKTAIFMPNITGLGKPLQKQNLIQKIIIKLLRYSLKSANVVFFQNKDNIEFFKEHNILSKDNKIVLLPGSGVDLNFHKVLPYPNKKTLKFVFISRILKEKGIDIYLETAKEIKKKYPNTEFHICGYCDEKKYKKIISNYQKEKIVIYHGEQKDIIPFFKMANAIIYPSYYPEGMSNVLLEAAAHARPIICTDNVGCKETVINDKSGFIVPIKNAGKVVEAVEKIINMTNEDRKQMGLYGRTKIEKEFDRNFVVKKYMGEISKERKMKLLFNCLKLNKGGAERVISILSNSLSNEKDVKIVMNMYSNIEYEFNENIQIESLIKKKDNKLLRKIRRISPIVLLKLKKSITNYNPDVIISFLPEANFRLLLLKKFSKKIRNIPIIISVRNDPNIEYKNVFYNYIMRKLYPLSNQIVLQTHDAKEYFKKCLNYNGVIIHNPVDSRFLNKSYNGVREKKIVAVGRLEKQKNYFNMINAFEIFHQKYSDYVLEIYGVGILKKKLINYVSKKHLTKYIFFKGKEDNLENKIYNASMYVMSSNYEGMPNALLEAACMGIPCVSTNCPCGGPKEILDNGQGGVLVPINNSEELANGMISIIENKEKSLEFSIRSSNNSKKYMTKEIVKEWDNVINNVIKDNK